MCRNVQDAEDVLQDTLINVAQHLGDFEGRSSLTSWVFALTRSACARKRRGLKNQPHVSDERLVESADLAPSPETRLANQELASALSVALDRLSDEHREAILLARTGCPDVVELWSKKLEGDLNQGDCSAMEKHIEACSQCGAACDALKRALLACHRARTEEVPPEVQARVKAAVRAWAVQSGFQI